MNYIIITTINSREEFILIEEISKHFGYKWYKGRVTMNYSDSDGYGGVTLKNDVVFPFNFVNWDDGDMFLTTVSNFYYENEIHNKNINEFIVFMENNIETFGNFKTNFMII